MTDYSAYAPSLPPAAPRAAAASSSSSSSHHHHQQQYGAGQQQHHRPGYGNGDALAGQFGSLSMAHPEQPHLGDPRARGPLAPPPPEGARSPAQSTFPSSTSSSSSSYSAANRPRPQLSPVLTSAPPRAYQLRDGPSAAYDHGPDSDAPRVPRKSSLAATHSSSAGAPGLQQAHSPLPRLPPSGSSSASLSHHASASGGSSQQRDSAGGEQVFDGTAFAAAAGEGPSGGFGGGAQGPSRSASSATATPGKKANPLADLIATETAYVADLGAIIKVRLSLCPPRSVLLASHAHNELTLNASSSLAARRSSMEPRQLSSTCPRLDVPRRRGRVPRQQGPARRASSSLSLYFLGAHFTY